MLIILKYFLSMTNPTDRAHFFTNVNLPLNLRESCGRYFFKVHQVHFLKNNSSLALGSNYSILSDTFEHIYAQNLEIFLSPIFYIIFIFDLLL